MRSLSFALRGGILLVTLTLFVLCGGAPVEDKINTLPLFGPPPTPQYSGYLDGTAGCDTSVNGAYCKVHYWFATAAGTNANANAGEDELETTTTTKNDKPVVLWLNGGPGSSSILGFLQETGPLLMNAQGGLMVNPYAWTNVANLLVIESPVGVGFSYCEAQTTGGVCQNTDKFTASTSRAALVDFFQNKFPELAGNDFFITGESYAGVYIPTLAYEILKNAPSISLTGLAVGDPCTDNEAQADSMDALWYGHKYGLVDDAVFDQLWNHCDIRFPNPLMKQLSQKKTRTNMQKLTNEEEHVMSTECKVAHRKFLLSTSRALSQSWRNMFIDDYSLFAPVTDQEDQAMSDYMNRPDVRAALHVQDAPVETWPYPEAGFDYTKEYKACNEDVDSNDPNVLSMLDFYYKIVPHLKVTWVYNGDTDPCVSYEGTRTAMSRVGFPEVDGGGYRPWFYNHTATTLQVLEQKPAMFGPDLLLQSTGAQFGGEIVSYEHNLSFLTVHGSGHMVPQFRPQAALHMLTKLIAYEELSPLLPSNATLATLCNKAFEKEMNKWTEQAKSSPYVV